MPQKPYITDFEDYFLPDDQPNNANGLSLEELGNAFGKIIAENPESADQVWADSGFSAVENAPTGNADSGANASSATEDSNLSSEQGADDSSANPASEEHAAGSASVNDGECPVTAESIFESALFVGNEDNDGWVSANSVCGLIRNLTEEEVEALADRIQDRWQTDERPYRLERSRGNYRMSLVPAFYPLRNKFYSTMREFQLPQPAINVLAIVAYQQPITNADVESLSKESNALALLNQLVRRGLLSVEKVGTGKKKTNLYRTTKRFLEFFNLESLEDLPTMEDI